MQGAGYLLVQRANKRIKHRPFHGLDVHCYAAAAAYAKR